MRTIASLRPFPMRVGNFVGNTIEKAAVLPISIPPRKKYLVYSLFTRGEGGPASAGSDEGATPYPTWQKTHLSVKNPHTSLRRHPGHPGGHPLHQCDYHLTDHRQAERSPGSLQTAGAVVFRRHDRLQAPQQRNHRLAGSMSLLQPFSSGTR